MTDSTADDRQHGSAVGAEDDLAAGTPESWLRDLRAATTRQDLAVLLQRLKVRADCSLRTLDARTATAPVRLAKATVGDVLAARRFPKKNLLLALVDELGATAEEVAAWRQAWERIAVIEDAADTKTTDLRRIRKQDLLRAQAAAETAEARCRAVEQEKSALGVQVLQAEAKNDHLNDLMQNLRAENKRIAPLEDRLRQAEADNIRLNDLAEDLGAENERLAASAARLEQVETENDRLNKLVQTLRAEKEQVEAKYTALNTEHSKLEEQIHSLAAEKGTENKSLRNLLDSIRPRRREEDDSEGLADWVATISGRNDDDASS